MQPKSIFNPFPSLTTERLLLRKLKETDEEVIFLLRSDEKVNEYIIRTKLKNKDQAGIFITIILEGIIFNKWIYWAIRLKANPELIGTICLWNFSRDRTVAEIGYELRPDYQGKGIMNEAMKAVLHYGFQKLNLKKIEAYTHRFNYPSTRILEKNNFKRDNDRKDPDNPDNIIFVLTPIDYIHSPNADQ